MSTRHTGDKEVAVISGGLGFLGSAIAKELLNSGYAVALLYLEPPEAGLENVVASFGSSDVHAFACDITDPQTVSGVLSAIEESVGPIKVAVHAAHTPFIRKKVTEVDPETFKKQFLVGVFGGFNFLHEAARIMRTRREGVLIGITTVAIESDQSHDDKSATGAKPHATGGYISAKFALKGLLSEFASALAGDNIRVYAVAPGFLAGGLNSDLPPRLFELLKEKAPEGRITEAADVAKAVVSLVQNDTAPLSDKMTLVVDRLAQNR